VLGPLWEKLIIDIKPQILFLLVRRCGCL